MILKNILLGLGGTGIIGGVSVGIYYGLKNEEKSNKSDSDDTNRIENEKDSNLNKSFQPIVNTNNSDSGATQDLLPNSGTK